MEIATREEEHDLGVEDGKQYNPPEAYSDDECPDNSDQCSNTNDEDEYDEQAEVELGSIDTNEEDVEVPHGVDSERNGYGDSTDLVQRKTMEDEDEDNEYSVNQMSGEHDRNQVVDHTHSEEEINREDADSDEESVESQGNDNLSEDDDASDTDGAEQDINETYSENEIAEVENDSDRVENDSDEDENDSDNDENDSDNDENDTDEEELGLSILMGPTIQDDELDAVDFIPKESDHDDFYFAASDEEREGTLSSSVSAEVLKKKDDGDGDLNHSMESEYDTDSNSKEGADDEETSYIDEEEAPLMNSVGYDAEDSDVVENNLEESDVYDSDDDDVEEDDVDEDGDEEDDGEEYDVEEYDHGKDIIEESAQKKQQEGNYEQLQEEVSVSEDQDENTHNEGLNYEEVNGFVGDCRNGNEGGKVAGVGIDDNKRRRKDGEEQLKKKMKMDMADFS